MAWLTLALLGHLLDAASTAILVVYFGAFELNPLFRPFADKFLILAAVKIGMVGVFYHYRGRRPWFPTMRQLALAGFFAFAWNVIIFTLSLRKRACKAR